MDHGGDLPKGAVEPVEESQDDHCGYDCGNEFFHHGLPRELKVDEGEQPFQTTEVPEETLVLGLKPCC